MQMLMQGMETSGPLRHECIGAIVPYMHWINRQSFDQVCNEHTQVVADGATYNANSQEVTQN